MSDEESNAELVANGRKVNDVAVWDLVEMITVVVKLGGGTDLYSATQSTNVDCCTEGQAKLGAAPHQVCCWMSSVIG